MESNNVLLAGLERVGLMFNPLRALATGRAEALARFERDTGWILAGDIQVLTGKLERLLTADAAPCARDDDHATFTDSTHVLALSFKRKSAVTRGR